jgi:hypothetical protein
MTEKTKTRVGFFALQGIIWGCLALGLWVCRHFNF